MSNSYFVWDSKVYGLKVSNMDEEHQKLIEIMNRLYVKNQEKAPKTVLVGIVDELVKYTVKHFKDEEAYMESIKYSALATHKIIHQKLLDTVGEHVAKYKADVKSEISEEFFVFLKTWLKSHIQGIDKKYAAEAGSKAS